MVVGAKRRLEDRTFHPALVTWATWDLGVVKSSAKYIAKGCLGDVVGVRLPGSANNQPNK